MLLDFFRFLAFMVIGNSPRRRVNVNFPFNAHNEAIHLYSLCSYAKRELISFHDFLKKCFLVMFEKKYYFVKKVGRPCPQPPDSVSPVS